MHVAAARLGGCQHRAVETGREQHGRSSSLARYRALCVVGHAGPEGRDRCRAPPRVTLRACTSVAKRIEFCYGHRLLDYNGVCAHPHGHNAVAELEIRADTLDARNMVMDFSDIKRAIKTWVDRELDHQMILRQDDPLVPVLQGMREPVYHPRQQSHRRAHRAADLRRGPRTGAARVAGDGVGNAHVVGHLRPAASGRLSRSISTARWSIPAATSLIRPTSWWWSWAASR